MRRALTLAVVLLPSLAGVAPAVAAPSSVALVKSVSHRAVCDAPSGPNEARCFARVVTDASGSPAVTTVPAGYGPTNLASAYGLAAAQTATSTQVIAIIDAYDAPNAEKDMAVYRSTFGLPACSSTGTNPCFRKVGQSANGRLPKVDAGWATEISLDLDMASAVCPRCRILLVEANSASFTDLGTAVNRAVALGATVISNSYGGTESSSATTLDAYYNHPGIAVTVSSGDSGYGVQYPASSRFVTAVGGTTLTRSTSIRGWDEAAWSGAGSGCSGYEAKPSWQKDTGCLKRSVADVAAVANPSTGVAVYDSTPYLNRSGWQVFGGTSVAAPIIAGIFALAGNSAAVNTLSFPYSRTASLFDITSGSNGTCTVAYLCTASSGFDGPTGLGTPNGIGAF